MTVTASPILSRREWISATEEAIAEDVSTRDAEQAEIVRLKIELEVGLDNRYYTDPTATGLPSPTTTLGKLNTRIASLEERVASRTRSINQRASLLEKARQEQLAEDQVEEARQAYEGAKAADAQLRHLIVTDLPSAGPYFETTYREAVQRADRCETCRIGFPVFKHFEAVLMEYVPKTAEIYVTRLEGRSYEPRNKMNAGLEATFNRSPLGTPDGFRLATGFGG